MLKSGFSILITTKNRKNDLAFTLNKIQFLLDRADVECIICDDGSTDDTASFIRSNYTDIICIRNEKSKGLIYSRNRLMSLVKTEFAISIDDDLHFITPNPLEIIQAAFNKNQRIALLSFRIFWGLEEPQVTICSETSHRIKSFAGGANVWRMKAWNDIPDYPDWFVFYGEEDFASFQLLKKKWEIYYLPEILVNHRVNLKLRKQHSDYMLRLRRSLRSGWYLYFLFFPWSRVPKLFLYTLGVQIKKKAFKGDLKAAAAIVLAIGDLIINIPRLIRHSNKLTREEFATYTNLSNTKLYWNPEQKNKLT